MKLSKNFTLEELLHSSTGKSLGIKNEANREQIINLVWLSITLQQIRDYIGKPLIVISGFRNEVLNKAVGGSKTSEHCDGRAADIKVDKETFEWIRENLEYNQLIWEFGNDDHPDWVHISIPRIGERGKMEVLKAVKKNGKTVYERI